MSSIIEAYQEELLKTKGSPVWDGFTEMLKILKNLFETPTHWVLEFIQNAEDAGSERLGIILQEGSLLIMNDGKPFDKNDFRAICNVNSSKRPAWGQLGYLGLGFKSIFRISDCVEIHSGDSHFKFDRKEWQDPKPFPWEIFPLVVNPLKPPKSYKTLFVVALKEDEIRERIKNFLENFPAETALLLKNLKEIEINPGERTSVITKELLERENVDSGEKETVLVKTNGNVSYYLIFRKTVKVPEEIKRDREVGEMKRSDIDKREIGLIFGMDEEKRLKSLKGRIGGVYSFLPIEGEQTGLPFGIFGDFIPNPGRDLIKYESKWNKWMIDEVVKFFKEIVANYFAPDDEWVFSIPALRATSSSTKNFWEDVGREINDFLDDGAFYPDMDGYRRKIDELMKVRDNELLEIVGREALEKTFGKKIVHPKLKDSDFWCEYHDLDDFFREAPKSVMHLKDNPEALGELYCLISLVSATSVKGRKSKIPYRHIPFVLAEDGEFYKPLDVAVSKAPLKSFPPLAKELLLEEKKVLHPVIAGNKDAVKQLMECDLGYFDPIDVRIQPEKITSKNDLPKGYTTDDLIECTLFLIAHDIFFSPEYLVSSDNSIEHASNLFVEGAPLDWSIPWKQGLLTGWNPINRKYFDNLILSKYKISKDKILEFLKKRSVHGFNKEDDTKLVENVAMNMAKNELKRKGHIPLDVSHRDRKGYDLSCNHCEMVFEIKGKSEPRDIDLTESEVRAVKEKGEKFKLIIVYNIPSDPKYIEISNPEEIWEPVNIARIPVNKWLR